MRSPILPFASSAPARLSEPDRAAGISVPISRYVVFFAIAILGAAADLVTKEWMFQWRGMPRQANEWWLIDGYVGVETAINRAQWGKDVNGTPAKTGRVTVQATGQTNVGSTNAAQPSPWFEDTKSFYKLREAVADEDYSVTAVVAGLCVFALGALAVVGDRVPALVDGARSAGLAVELAHEVGLSALYTSALTSGRFAADRGSWLLSARSSNLDRVLADVQAFQLFLSRYAQADGRRHHLEQNEGSRKRPDESGADADKLSCQPTH